MPGSVEAARMKNTFMTGMSNISIQRRNIHIALSWLENKLYD